MISQLERLYRRILMLIGRGEIKLVDDSKVVQIVQVNLGPLETRDNTPRSAEYGFASNPPAGTDCVLLFVGGDRDNGIVIATNNKGARLKNLQPGEVAIHDDQGRWIWLKRGSIEIDAKNTPVDVNNVTVLTAKAATKIRFETPLLECTGQITATGNITSQATVTGTTDVVGGGKSLKTHVHSGVTAGGANTGQPV